MTTGTRLALLSALAFPWVLSAQGSDAKDSLPDVASLRAPSTPAFVLLGISPSDVARPQTPGDLALDLLNKSSAGSGLPQDIALEASPFWLVQHTRLTWRADTTRSIWDSMVRTLALSLGTKSNADDAAPSTGLGVGARTMLLSGRLSDTTVKLLGAVEASAAAQGHTFNRYRKLETDRIDALMAAELRPCAAMPTVADRVKCAGEVAARHKPMRDSVTQSVLANPEYQREIAHAEKMIDEFSLVREGWFWEVAGGAAWDFANGAWANAKRARLGAWSTLSHEGGKLGDGTTWTPILVGRYLKEDTTNSLSIADLGGRLVMSGPQYAVSAEFVGRFWSGTNAPKLQHRLSAMVEYKVRDDMWLFGAFGKDYADVAKDSFITRFGLSLSLKKERYKGKT
jgi:hypothetical protein